MPCCRHWGVIRPLKCQASGVITHLMFLKDRQTNVPNEGRSSVLLSVWKRVCRPLTSIFLHLYNETDLYLFAFISSLHSLSFLISLIPSLLCLNKSPTSSTKAWVPSLSSTQRCCRSTLTQITSVQAEPRIAARQPGAFSTCCRSPERNKYACTLGKSPYSPFFHFGSFEFASVQI